MISAESFRTRSLAAVPNGDAVRRILAAAVHAVEPGEAVRRWVSEQDGILTISGESVDPACFRKIALLGVGKASVAMSAALAGSLGSRLTEGLVVTKHAPSISNLPFRVIEGGHPVPDERSLAAGRDVREFLAGLGRDDLLFCLISGGGSALMTSPAEGVRLADLRSMTAELLACGARIDEINGLRRRLDHLKGGGLARLANGAKVISLMLSDVVGDALEAIASGPTAPDPLDRSTAIAVISKYGLEERIPAALRRVLETAPETPKPGDPLFDRVRNILVGNNRMAAQAAIERAHAEGFRADLLRTDLQGEAREAGSEFAGLLREKRAFGSSGSALGTPECLVAGGETTVTVRGDGRGGRNTELGLAAAIGLEGVPDSLLVSLATDGEDGPTDAAGAAVTGDTCRRAAELGFDAAGHLERNDSYAFFNGLDDLIKTGPTGTNVNDLVFLFRF
jgi:glycerate 2-kinase